MHSPSTPPGTLEYILEEDIVAVEEALFSECDDGIEFSERKEKSELRSAFDQRCDNALYVQAAKMFLHDIKSPLMVIIGNCELVKASLKEDNPLQAQLDQLIERSETLVTNLQKELSNKAYSEAKVTAPLPKDVENLLKKVRNKTGVEEALLRMYSLSLQEGPLHAVFTDGNIEDYNASVDEMASLLETSSVQQRNIRSICAAKESLRSLFRELEDKYQHKSSLRLTLEKLDVGSLTKKMHRIIARRYGIDDINGHFWSESEDIYADICEWRMKGVISNLLVNAYQAASVMGLGDEVSLHVEALSDQEQVKIVISNFSDGKGANRYGNGMGSGIVGAYTQLFGGNVNLERKKVSENLFEYKATVTLPRAA